MWDGSADSLNQRSLCIVPLPDMPAIKASNAASVDLRLGRWFRTMRQTKLTEIKAGDGSHQEEISREHYVRFDSKFVLHPGQFVLGITLEWLHIPADLSAYVTGKSSWGRRGLIIETAAGIHPGFTGCLTLELANIGSTPITLNPGMQICQIFLHDVRDGDADATTQFIGRRKPGLGKVDKDAISVSLAKPYFT
jgi:dCTP deaminase